ncbi:MAG: AAA family ATPase [Acidobacteria bacterium]|nr:AAA family ATPase [Acidobacteriota bacterium]
MGLLDRLNPQQKQAVLHEEGPLLLLAGAGSGKTRVIISRIAHLVKNKGIPPHAILAVTFTNKAAGEMRDRVSALLVAEGLSPSSTPTVATFHSFCVRLLRMHGDPLREFRPGFTRSFNIYDDADQIALIKSIFKDLGLDEKAFMKPRAAQSILSQAKNQGRSAQDFYRDATSPQSERLAVVFERYQEALQKANALDFDDLLLEAVRLLKKSKPTRELVGGRYEYVMVDEYQDTNRAQYDLLQLLTESHDNVCVVGDEDQSIYSWRGADIQNILDFERDFPNATVIRLEQNYRSTQRILEAAGKVVSNNKARKGKKLWTEGDAGEQILFYQGDDAEAEALFVADFMHQYLLDSPKSRAAVLYRTNAQSRQMEEALRRFGRKYLVVGGVSFYQRAEVKDLVAYLKTAQSPGDAISLLRIINTPARGIGKTTIDALQGFAYEEKTTLWEAICKSVEEHRFPARAHAALKGFWHLVKMAQQNLAEKPVDEGLLWVYEQSGYRRALEEDPSVEAEARRENVNELLNAAADAAQRGEDIQSFLDHAALVADSDRLDEAAQITLMTLHNAKGLEFPLVAMLGMEEGLFPHSRSFEDEAAMEEERRLCYVGMTRAERQLILTCARTRRRWGGGAPDWMAPSRFLGEIPPELIDDRTVGGSELFGLAPSPSERTFVTAREADLFSERHQVRSMAESRLAGASHRLQGKTYDSADAVAQFFQQRGIPVQPAGGKPPAGRPPAAKPGAKVAPKPGVKPSYPPLQSKPKLAARPPASAPAGSLGRGARVRHSRYGVGTIVRQEGDGDQAKVTVMFQGHGLKKLVLKYAGLQPA